MSTDQVGNDAVNELKDGFQGQVILPRDKGYEEARTLFNAMIDKRPAVIAQCATPDDCRGRSRSGAKRARRSRCERRALGRRACRRRGRPRHRRAADEAVKVDADARTARCRRGRHLGGVRPRDAGARARDHRRARLDDRRRGLHARRRLRLARTQVRPGVRQPDLGRPRDRRRANRSRASEDEHPSCSGRCTAAAATSASRRRSSSGCIRSGPIVLAGLMLWPASAGPRSMRRCARPSPTRPTSSRTAMRLPHRPPEEFVPARAAGPAVLRGVGALGRETSTTASAALAPFRALEPAVDLVGPMPYADFQCMIDDPPGLRNYWSAEYLDELSDEAIDVFVTTRIAMPAVSRQPHVPWGGAVARVGAGDTPMAKRDAKWVVPPVRAVGEAADDDAAHRLGARHLGATSKPFATGGVYLNFIGDEGQDRVRAAFGDELRPAGADQGGSTTRTTSSAATRTSSRRSRGSPSNPWRTLLPNRSSTRSTTYRARTTATVRRTRVGRCAPVALRPRPRPRG